MKKTIRSLLLALALFLLAWFAADIPFYPYADPLTRASLAFKSDDAPLSFTYSNDAITLHGAGDADVYALALDGMKEIDETSLDSLPADLLGSFAAVLPAYNADTDGDGVSEQVIEAAKTDMEYTMEYSVGGNAFLDPRLPFEAVFLERQSFQFYYDAVPLSGAEMTAVLSDGTILNFTTDSEGISKALSLIDVREGVTFLYRPDAEHTFVMRYQPEDNTVFSLRWLSAMMPFTIIVLLSIVCIALDLLLRKRLYQKAGLAGSRTDIFHSGAVRRRPRFGFETLRWTFMILSFVLLVWGGRLLGTAFSQVQLPVLACPYNLDQGTSAGCYLFGHLDLLLESSLDEILWFVGSFAVSALLFGRMLCGFVCPLGLVQDLMHETRQALHVEGVALTEKLYAVLRFIKWVLLSLFLGIGLIGGSFCDFCPAITLSPALAGFKTSVYFSGFLMVAVLVSGFFKRRCFCNICPMGYLLGLPHKVSLARLKKDAVACTECGACYEACPMGIRSVFTLREGKNERAIDVTTADCIFCGECIRRCPEDGALFMTLAGVRIYQASRMKFMRDYASQSKGDKT